MPINLCLVQQHGRQAVPRKAMLITPNALLQIQTKYYSALLQA